MADSTFPGGSAPGSESEQARQAQGSQVQELTKADKVTWRKERAPTTVTLQPSHLHSTHTHYWGELNFIPFHAHYLNKTVGSAIPGQTQNNILVFLRESLPFRKQTPLHNTETLE